MKKIVVLLIIGLIVQPTWLAADGIKETFEDLTEGASSGVLSRVYEVAKTGGEYTLAFAVGFVGYLLLCAASATVRKKTVRFLKGMAQRIAQIKARYTYAAEQDRTAPDC